MTDNIPSNPLTDRELLRACLGAMREAHKIPGCPTDWSLMIDTVRRQLEESPDETSDYTKVPEVINPPASAAQGAEARNLSSPNVMGLEEVHRAAEARPANVAPLPNCECGHSPRAHYIGSTDVKGPCSNCSCMAWRAENGGEKHE